MELLLIAQWIQLLFAPCILLGLYIYWNDRRLTRIPTSALYFSPKRCTAEDARAAAERLASEGNIVKEVLPPKTGRRYIVVGGGGFLGAWIATKLLERGEEFHRIRLLDLNPPANHVVKDALPKGIQFIKVDVTDPAALEEAFKAPWPKLPSDQLNPEPELTVFHTAANIRFYERHLDFLDRSARVNVEGTRNVIACSRAAGATVLVYTSSGSVGVRNTRFLLWPWEKGPQRFVQVVDDDDARLPRRHEDFFSNYAATKIRAERLVRAADGVATRGGMGVLKTGCIRPGNGIFGPRGDMLCGAYLMRKANPTWISNMVQSFCYVENCAAAHLCYEARLIELVSNNPNRNPDIGGQAFCVADPGTTPTYGDVYTSLEALTDGECTFPVMSPTGMLLIAHVVEWYYRAHQALLRRGGSSWQWFAKMLPVITGDIINLQPSLFSLTSVHLIFDDSHARLPPSKGGLGYSGAWTTLEGLVKTVEEHKSGVGRSERRSDTAGVSIKFDWRFGFGKEKDAGKAKLEKVTDKIADGIPVITPVEVSKVQ